MVPLANPFTGTMIFGRLPALRLDGVICPDADAFLFVGKHLGPNRGFGAKHIWAEHRSEMAKAGLFQESEVANYVLTILRTGTPLIFEGASWRVTRLMAVRACRLRADSGFP